MWIMALFFSAASFGICNINHGGYIGAVEGSRKMVVGWTNQSVVASRQVGSVRIHNTNMMIFLLLYRFFNYHSRPLS